MNLLQVFVEVKSESNRLPSKHFEDGSRAGLGLVEQEAGFRHDGLAGEERRLDIGKLGDGPLMMSILGIEQGDDRASVDDDLLLHRP
jgi:hypothetical protein